MPRKKGGRIDMGLSPPKTIRTLRGAKNSRKGNTNKAKTQTKESLKEEGTSALQDS